jgi:hypothetical protein
MTVIPLKNRFIEFFFHVCPRTKDPETNNSKTRIGSINHP